MTTEQQVSWHRLVQQAEGLLSVSSDQISNAANLSALLYQELPDVSWVGFYFLNDEKLMLGPFQGKPACVSIDLGKGVCGTAASTGETLRIADVEAFDGHIACDPKARSEIVVPLFRNGELLGVLDIDSTSLDRFSVNDEEGVKLVAQEYLSSIA